MRLDEKKTLAYFCPACRQAVIAEKSVFALSASAAEISCLCGGSHIRAELAEGKFRLTVPCLFCGREHTVACSAASFLNADALAFSCAASGLDCCYAGDADRVAAAMARQQAVVDKLDADRGERGAFLNPVVMEEVLSELRDIAARDKISCRCGERRYRLKVHYSSIDVICAACGATARIPAATMDDVERICCRDDILIQSL